MNQALTRLILAALVSLALGACAATPGQQETIEEEPVKTYEFEPWDGDGMDIPLDGSSLEAFETSLARVQAHTTPSNYTTLVNAIEYLLVYDLEIKRDRARLAAKLDGQTPYDVLQRVGWRKPAPGKSAAEKGAADATIDI
ncbi:MAG: hypothetical protein EHM68_12540 [Lysobacterales bacterium]|nr:MAG: hypothetical protein EHM68_12540 [Xanthomonadales bacterium]